MSSTTRMSEAEAAEYIGISKTHLACRRRADDGPAYFRIGRKILYSQEALDAYLEKCMHSCGCAAKLNTATEVKTDLF